MNFGEHNDIRAQMSAVRYPQFYLPAMYISLANEQLLCDPHLEPCSIHWCHHQYVDFEAFKLSIRSLSKAIKKSSFPHTIFGKMLMITPTVPIKNTPINSLLKPCIHTSTYYTNMPYTYSTRN